AAILAVLKAGAAYVPLDPASPGERLRRILDDTASPVLLTRGRVVSGQWSVVREEEGVTVLATGQHLRTTDHSPLTATAGDLAYVIYTSGSTGRPKGVMVEHRSICNTVLWRMRQMAIGPDDRALLVVPYFF